MEDFTRTSDGFRTGIYISGLSSFIKSIKYDLFNVDIEKKKIKKLISGRNELFKFNTYVFDNIINYSLYPAYYLLNFDKLINEHEKLYDGIIKNQTDSYFELLNQPFDLEKYEKIESDATNIEFKLDLQLYNNIIFVIANSNEFTTFFRSVWNRIIDIFCLLAEDDYKLLENILKSRYNYDSTEIEDYCNNFNRYIFYFYENKILENMKQETCYTCYSYFRSLMNTPIPRKVYIDLYNEFNTFILECLNNKIYELRNSGYCKDIFENDFFAYEILKLDGLNSTALYKTKENLFNYYYDCIKVRVDKGAYKHGKECYEIIEKNKYAFSNNQIKMFEEQNSIILSNYDKDPIVKKEKLNNFLYKAKERFEYVVVILFISCILSLILTVMCGFKVNFFNIIFLFSLMFFSMCYLISKILDRFL